MRVRGYVCARVLGEGDAEEVQARGKRGGGGDYLQAGIILWHYSARET